MMEEGTTTGKTRRGQKRTEGKRLYEVDDMMVYSIVVIGERRGRGKGNKEPKKKKGTLAKIADRGGRFGKSSKSRDNTPTKNFLKKSPISNP